MREKEIGIKIDEDTWLDNIILKNLQKLGASILPKELGGSHLRGFANIRDWADDLYNSWQEAEGAGSEQTRVGINRWLNSGDYSFPQKAINTAFRKSQMGRFGKDVKADNAETRDFFQRLAQEIFKIDPEGFTKDVEDHRRDRTTKIGKSFKPDSKNDTDKEKDTKIQDLERKVDRLLKILSDKDQITRRTKEY